MELKKRIEAFAILGNYLKQIKENNALDNLNPIGCSLHQKLLRAIDRTSEENQWLTRENIYLAISAIADRLTVSTLHNWTNKYPELRNHAFVPKKIGVVMAGNIPLVGFHDLLCVLISGNILKAKTSSKDDQLLKVIGDILISIAPDFNHLIFFEENRLENFDAIIATGSNNTSRYFEYYFGKYPNIIRKNRNSVAILSGNETLEELQLLGKDIFSYFGLGCRNVSKLYIPEGYDIQLLNKAFNDYRHIIGHHKYANNYNYNKTLFLMNKTSYIDHDFFLLKEDKGLSSPVSVIYYEYYSNIPALEKQIGANKESIQCTVSGGNISLPSIGFGEAQHPELWDYPDNVDTMEFLLNLKKTSYLS